MSVKRRKGVNGHAKRTQGTRGIIVYKTYMFKTKDPVIDELRTLMQDEGATYKEIHDAGGPTEGTLYNWFKGTTRCPSNAAVRAAAGAMGYRAGRWVKERR